MKQRLDVYMAAKGLVSSRSQAESYVRLGQVKVNGVLATKSGVMVSESDQVDLKAGEQYVGRAALKLKSAAETFALDFRGKTVLDVGSSTGGFTQFVLLHGASQVFAVELGTDQLHPTLRSDPRIELHEQTDIRDVRLRANKAKLVDQQPYGSNFVYMSYIPDFVVADVSFISLRELLPSILNLVNKETFLVMMVKPQFEASLSGQKHKGVIKNDRMRRDILKDFEMWSQKYFRILQKADSEVPGSKGNVERFYLLRKLV